MVRAFPLFPFPSSLNTTFTPVGLKSNRLLFPLLDFVLVAQPQELRRMGYKVGVRRPTPRAGQSHIPTLTVRRRTRQGHDAEEIQV